MNIRDLVPIGHENAISRLELMKITGLNYPSLKEAISRSNKEGECYIGNMQDGLGYFIFDLPSELDLLDKYLALEGGRAYATLERIRKMSGTARRLHFGRDLKSTRLEKGLTQLQLSKKTKISLFRIRAIENQKVEATKEEMKKIKEVLRW